MTIEIVNLQRLMEVPERKIRAVLRHVMIEELGHEVNVSVAVVGDRRIAELNRTFLNRTGPTDVLAFPFSGKPPRDDDAEEVFGEIVISAGRARRQARERRVAAEFELILYAAHGMLHLVGYDDRTAAQAKEMRRREAEVLRRLAPPKGAR